MFAKYFISHLKILKASNSKLFYCDLVIFSSKRFNFRKEKKWLITSNTLEDYSIPRNLLLEGTEPVSGAVYQLYGFCDASDSAYSCVVYLRGLHAGKSRIILSLENLSLFLRTKRAG